MRQRLSLLLMTLVLTACGTQDDSLETLQALRDAIIARRVEPVDLRAAATPEIIAGVGRPVLYFEAPDRGSRLLFVEDLRNGENISWISPSNEVIVLQRGVLVATRGAGGDLMSADVADVHAALAGRSNRAERVHRYLDGENHVVTQSFVCEYSRRPDSTSAYYRQLPATRVDETCYSPDTQFSNRYWIADSGEVLRSEQWVGEAVGHISYERLSNWAS